MNISNYVKETRKVSHLNVSQFAKQYGISDSKLKKLECGGNDEPTPLIASNFCKVFNITPEEFVTMFDFKYSGSSEFATAINSYLQETLKENVFENIAHKYNLQAYKKSPVVTEPDIMFPCEMIYISPSGEKIAACSFKYNKVHETEKTLKTYNYALQSITKAIAYKTSICDSTNCIVKNIMAVVSSKKLFMELEKLKNQLLNNTSDINVMVILLPKHNSTAYATYNICGNNFLQ